MRVGRMVGLFGLCWLLSGCLEGTPTVTLKEDIADILANDATGDVALDMASDVDNEQACQPVCDGKNCGDDDQCGGKCIVDAGCDDGDPCTSDYCGQDGACAHDNTEAACDDGDACTVGDACKEGKCEAGEDPLDCDDGNPCTDDSCDPAVGCVHDNGTGDCSDGDACTVGDKCEEGACKPGDGVPDCDDKNPCTDDSCVTATGCKNDPNTEPCDDENPCTLGDECKSGDCLPGKWKDNCCTGDADCDDLDQCTKDACIDPGADGACQNEAIVGAKCDDGDPVTKNDVCILTKTGVVLCAGIDGSCGDKVCKFPENAYADPEDPKKPAIPGDPYFCLVDCGWCGDTICKPDVENVTNCPQDCYPTCGDKKCQYPEQAGNPAVVETYCVVDCGGCGDKFCGLNETPQTCPGDCPLGCGDGICNGDQGENAESCFNDCPPPCGDEKCTVGESSDMCPVDCGYCGDGVCVISKEDKESCPKDCDIPCGDGKCEGNEGPENCAVDCGPCGDALCALTETPLLCPQDCASTCGNSTCDAQETAKTCFIDCCTQQCEGKQCGPDGCDGACGICPEGLFCNENTGECK